LEKAPKGISEDRRITIEKKKAAKTAGKTEAEEKGRFETKLLLRTVLHFFTLLNPAERKQKELI